MNKRAKGNTALILSLLFLGLMCYGIKTCEKQMKKGQEEIRRAGERAHEGVVEAGERLARQVKESEEELKKIAEKIPERIIGDFKENFGSLCTLAKGHLCDNAQSQYCRSEDLFELEAFAGSRDEKQCCKTACLDSPPGIGRSGYPLQYTGGNALLTCAFQRAEDCRAEKYCQDEQWIKSVDTQTCCKSMCVERIQHKDVFFDRLGYATVERFSGNRFGTWYGTGVGNGFYELGKPNYAEARRTGEIEYVFKAEGKEFLFFVTQNEPSLIRISTKKGEPIKLPDDVKEIIIGGNKYAPETQSVKEGTTIVWVNEDSVPHTITFDDGTDLGTISPGGRLSLVTTKKATLSYHCSFHPTMKGKIIVE